MREKKESSGKEKKQSGGYPCRGEGLYWNTHSEHFRINLLASNSDYDSKVAEIKAMEGKWWSKTKKCWYVPPTEFQKIIDYVKKWKITATPESVKKAKELFMVEYKKRKAQAA